MDPRDPTFEKITQNLRIFLQGQDGSHETSDSVVDMAEDGQSEDHGSSGSTSSDFGEGDMGNENQNSEIHEAEMPIGVQTRRMARGIKNYRKPVSVTKKKKMAPSAMVESQESCILDLDPSKPTTPFQVSLILYKVLGYLQPKDLKICRLVSSSWNVNARCLLKLKHSPVAFVKQSEISKFNRAMKRSEVCPYSNFSIRCRYTARLEKYFQPLGPDVSTLQILSWPGRNLMDFNQVFQIFKFLPNLKELILFNTEFPKASGPPPKFATLTAPPPIIMEKVEKLTISGWFMAPGPISTVALDMHAQQCIVNLMNCVPNIKQLELGILRGAIIQNFLVSVSRLKSLQTLIVHCVGETELTHLIKPANLLTKLNSITFREVHLSLHGVKLLELLESYAQKLEHLHMRVLTTADVRLVTFPEMPAMKTLHLETFQSTARFTLDPTTIRGLNPFPALRVLSVSQCVLEGMMLAEYRSSTVVELTLKMSPIPLNGFRNGVQDDDDREGAPFYDSRQASVVIGLRGAFPALKKLKVLDIRCSVLRILFRTLNHLEELEICHAFQRYGLSATVDLNRVLTGVKDPFWLANKYYDYKVSSTTTPGDLEGALKFIHFVSPDSIRNMKNLKVLTFSGRQCIEDSAVKLGLLQMQPLDRLVFNEKSVCFGDRTLQLLRKHHKMVQILKSVPPKKSYAELFY